MSSVMDILNNGIQDSAGRPSIVEIDENICANGNIVTNDYRPKTFGRFIAEADVVPDVGVKDGDVIVAGAAVQ